MYFQFPAHRSSILNVFLRTKYFPAEMDSIQWSKLRGHRVAIRGDTVNRFSRETLSNPSIIKLFYKKSLSQGSSRSSTATEIVFLFSPARTAEAEAIDSGVTAASVHLVEIEGARGTGEHSTRSYAPSILTQSPNIEKRHLQH